MENEELHSKYEADDTFHITWPDGASDGLKKFVIRCIDIAIQKNADKINITGGNVKTIESLVSLIVSVKQAKFQCAHPIILGVGENADRTEGFVKMNSEQLRNIRETLKELGRIE